MQPHSDQPDINMCMILHLHANGAPSQSGRVDTQTIRIAQQTEVEWWYGVFAPMQSLMCLTQTIPESQSWYCQCLYT